MNDGGWFKVYRKLLDDPLWFESTPPQKVVLITLLGMANHSKRQWIWDSEKFTAEPGQFVTSIDSIRKKSGKGVSTQNVRTSLRKFEKFGFLTNKVTKTGRLITIVNWAKYQGGDGYLTKELTKSQQRPNKELTPNKNVRSKEVSNNGHSDLESDFAKLWNLYPRKQGRKAAFAAYKRVVTRKKDPATNKQIQDGIVAYVKQLRADGTEKQYIKQGSTYFNQEAWNDDVSSVTETISSPPSEPHGLDPRQAVYDYWYGQNGDADKALQQMHEDKVPIDDEEATALMKRFAAGGDVVA